MWLPFYVSVMQDNGSIQWMEFFAGQAEATRMFDYGGFKTAKLDIMYMSAEKGRQNPMDLTTDAGMATFGSKKILSNLYFIRDIYRWSELYGDCVFPNT